MFSFCREDLPTLSSTVLSIDWKIHHPNVDSKPMELLGVDHSPGDFMTQDIWKLKEEGPWTTEVVVAGMFSIHLYFRNQKIRTGCTPTPAPSIAHCLVFTLSSCLRDAKLGSHFLTLFLAVMCDSLIYPHSNIEKDVLPSPLVWFFYHICFYTHIPHLYFDHIWQQLYYSDKTTQI